MCIDLTCRIRGFISKIWILLLVVLWHIQKRIRKNVVMNFAYDGGIGPRFQIRSADLLDFLVGHPSTLVTFVIVH